MNNVRYGNITASDEEVFDACRAACIHDKINTFTNVFITRLKELTIRRHRLSTIMNADRIVVVENGQVVEQGSHNELIVANGRYADLWSKQVFLRPREKLDLMDFIDDRPVTADDLSSEQTATEHSKQGDMDSDSEGNTTDTYGERTADSTGTATTHRKEV
ncbi:hypothetical protein UVI_02060690 [Ustilaginoidea virens]|uniref:Uncharacterized protein n=1 Tax=Ustilaginoidea virens TaxID=1159556 RepID=A0A1B5L683_USTVR|nr:hypothetical protein UVI_02060690 [Ustilaginoidea virens]